MPAQEKVWLGTLTVLDMTPKGCWALKLQHKQIYLNFKWLYFDQEQWHLKPLSDAYFFPMCIHVLKSMVYKDIHYNSYWLND